MPSAASNSATRDSRLRGLVSPGLQLSRDFVIPDQHEQVSEAADFEPTTWLVIKAR